MSDTVTINGIPYRAPPYLSYGDYDNSCMVERANVRAVLEMWPGRTEMHADPADHRSHGDVWTIEAPDTAELEARRSSWLTQRGPGDALLRAGGGWRDVDVSGWGCAFLPRARNAPRRVPCDKATARAAANRHGPGVGYVRGGPGYRYGVATRAPYVLHGTGSHGYTYLWLRTDVRTCSDVLDSLDSYPCIDDELVSEMETDAETEHLEDTGYRDVARAAAKELAAEYGLDVSDLDDVVTEARTRGMWSWEWLESGPDPADWHGQLTFSHEQGGAWIDPDKVAARFLVWDAFENDPDGLHLSLIHI